MIGERLYLVAGLLAAWQCLSWAGLLPELFFASPLQILYSACGLFAGGSIWPDFGSTVWRVFVAFVLAAVTGTPAGISIAYFKRVGYSTEVLMEFLRSIPPIALFPLFIFFFGIGDTSKIAVGFFSGTMIIAIAAMYGTKQINRTRLLLAKRMGLGGSRLFFRVLLPESLPTIIGGYRLAASICLILVITTEMFLGSNLGLGVRLVDARMLYDIPQLYALIAIAGATGYAINMLFLMLEKRIVHWQGK